MRAGTISTMAGKLQSIATEAEDVYGGGQPSTQRWLLWPLLLATALIMLLGVIEDLYGKTDAGDVYGSDAVQYLDIARALERHDWHSALNPLWS